jgi:sulfur carrier protein
LIHLMIALISIELNGLAATVEAGSTLADLLIREGLIERRIAVEYNGEIVPRSAYGDIRLAPGDRLEVVHAIGGGAL